MPPGAAAADGAGFTIAVDNAGPKSGEEIAVVIQGDIAVALGFVNGYLI